jgi:hypothetical protein
MTLAPKTGEVSWVSMGLQRVPFLAEVSTLPSESQDSSSILEVVDLEVKFRGVSPTVSGRAGSMIGLASGCYTAARWHPAPRDSLSRVVDQGATCSCAAASRPIGYGPLIFCGCRDGCPTRTQSWLTIEGAVASTSLVLLGKSSSVAYRI